ncbi:uncharacterized protein EKO05_0009364 [Ascochyta rabiei]|uniref:uncharacterized protein n=1 Tax=Didymella rabiei TaxID=5454 RepID=UPI0021FD4556|nr:uncharacterized protein EKO05_0009364 [Ascochyta rabiei]UPX19090.1 hypothetical protein EKO05_0009364 [Ascochyta rabiei]
MGEYLKSSHKAQNLARIRDNQRRSRARRKEYLQELEARLRNCDQAGIEASAEIQNAARKVLDENKKLRSLLSKHGVSDADIVAALGGPTVKSFEQVSVTSALSNALDRRITNSVVSSTPLPQQARGASIPGHLPSVPSLSIPPSCPATLSSCESLSPTSIESSMGTPPVSYHTTLYAPITSRGPEIKVDYDYRYESTQNPPWSYSQAYTNGSDYASCYNTSSCVDAANIIRAMHSDPGPMYHVDQLSQPYYSNHHIPYPITTTYPQPYSGT